ncbi:nucleotidyl transferase AbiEii/AbiGii toxin family protein [Nitrincola sp. MINF-07-Sa-05]|uniref:nucleotidyl transferase AbiEii/AbiGii toxin family protein n=1 Tax=Nitrincola salilacus TaxID=3400273 RepID=UPI0039184681
MYIFDYYRAPEKREELKQILLIGAQKHPDGLPDFFLEKDLWVTEILRLLYDEQLLGDYAVAFKGGTALSKCWKAIDRFSEDIDLSIHWADLAEVEEESAAWAQSIRNPSQQKKFRERQTARLTEWSCQLVEKLNQRFAEYGIEELSAKLEVGSHGEKINIQFPRVTESENHYHLDYVLLEFGGRNRGQPTVAHKIGSYMADIPELQDAFDLPTATVQAYDPAYIIWEKLTALHQYSTMEKEPNKHRLARHWYDVDCMLEKDINDPFSAKQARDDVVEMKKQRWAEKGVDYELALRGQLKLIPDGERLAGIADDHRDAIQGRMFFTHQHPDDFDQIISRLTLAQNNINKAILTDWITNNAHWAYSGAWMQAVLVLEKKKIRSEMTLIENPQRAIDHLVNVILSTNPSA